jgi:hypothetical protein
VIVAHFFWPDTMQVNVFGHDERNGMLQNIFHVHSDVTIDESVCADVAAIVNTWVSGTYTGCYAENISSDRIIVTDVSLADGDQAEQPSNHAGSLLGIALPSQNTLAVKKSTGKRGRANRGDWYVWPATVDQIEVLDGNLFLESYRDTCVAALNLLLTNLNGGGYNMVVASQATGLTRVVKSFVATDRLVDSQNRRGGDRGR